MKETFDSLLVVEYSLFFCRSFFHHDDKTCIRTGNEKLHGKQLLTAQTSDLQIVIEIQNENPQISNRFTMQNVQHCYTTS